MENTNGSNGTTETSKVRSVILDGAKNKFEQRKGPAKESEVKAAIQAYFKADDAVSELQTKLEATKAARTQATIGVVELRGMGRIGTKTRGVGQVVNRGESAWISFASAEAEAFDV